MLGTEGLVRALPLVLICLTMLSMTGKNIQKDKHTKFADSKLEKSKLYNRNEFSILAPNH